MFVIRKPLARRLPSGLKATLWTCRVPLEGRGVPGRSAHPTPSPVLSAESAGQAFAVRAVGHAVDLVGVPLEGEEFLAGLRIPHFHHFVMRSAGQAFAVRAVGHAVDLVGVPLAG